MRPRNIKVIVESMLANRHAGRAENASAKSVIPDCASDSPSIRGQG
jgi:hypothetical protein